MVVLNRPQPKQGGPMKDKPIEREYLVMVPINNGEWLLKIRQGVIGDWETKQHFTRDGLITAMESLREDVTDITTEVIGAEIDRQQEELDATEPMEEQERQIVGQYRRDAAPAKASV